jgi:pimeloyl-ACP methyl ester carboxylesterase
VTYEEYLRLRKKVATPHGELAYLDVGDGPAAVFVHGLFMSGYRWHRTIDQVKHERRCIAYNLPAHGGSEVSDEQELSLESNVAMLGPAATRWGSTESTWSPTTRAVPSPRAWRYGARAGSARRAVVVLGRGKRRPRGRR